MEYWQPDGVHRSWKFDFHLRDTNEASRTPEILDASHHNGPLGNFRGATVEDRHVALYAELKRLADSDLRSIQMVGRKQLDRSARRHLSPAAALLRQDDGSRR
jgi:hypothetical protein